MGGLLGVTVAVLILTAPGQSEISRPGAASVPFRQAPDFQFTLVDQRLFHLADVRSIGKPILINFWASWCGPCAAEAPILESAWQRYRGRVTIVGVNDDEADSDARAFLSRYSISYPNGVDVGARISRAYGGTGIPRSYFITSTGRVVRFWDGEMTETQLDTFLREVVAASGVDTVQVQGNHSL